MIKLKDLLKEDVFIVYGRKNSRSHWVLNHKEHDRKRAERLAQALTKDFEQVAIDQVPDIGGDVAKYDNKRKLSSKATIIKEAVDPKFDKAANVFLKSAQALIDAHMKKSFPNLPRKELSFDKGRKYWRIVARDKDIRPSGSAWAFLNTENGDVLKPASWRAPAKHARGNIYDTQGGMKGVGPYGPAYMR